MNTRTSTRPRSASSNSSRGRRVRTLLEEWKAAVPNLQRTANLVGELYELLDVLKIREWDLANPMMVNRLGTLARFTSLLVDYESVRRVWETERPFELHLDGVTVTGRADVILDREGGVPSALAIVDYKTSTVDGNEHGLQLQVYVDAGRREGLDVRAGYVHDLKAAARQSVPVDRAAVQRAEEVVTEAAARIRARDYRPNPGARCRRCEVRTICPSSDAPRVTR